LRLTEMVNKVAAMTGLVDGTIKSVRRISTELRPGILDDLGFTAALEWLANDFQEHTGISCQIVIPPKEPLLDRNHSTALFRICQEGLTNVARHAAATAVNIEMRLLDGLLSLEISDNGRGICLQELSPVKSFGIQGMRERALDLGGALDLDSAPGRGTRIKVTLPTDGCSPQAVHTVEASR
jgi:signal transduction histidine kinase